MLVSKNNFLKEKIIFKEYYTVFVDMIANLNHYINQLLAFIFINNNANILSITISFHCKEKILNLLFFKNNRSKV